MSGEGLVVGGLVLLSFGRESPGARGALALQHGLAWQLTPRILATLAPLGGLRDFLPVPGAGSRPARVGGSSAIASAGKPGQSANWGLSPARIRHLSSGHGREGQAQPPRERSQAATCQGQGGGARARQVGTQACDQEGACGEATYNSQG